MKGSDAAGKFLRNGVEEIVRQQLPI